MDTLPLILMLAGCGFMLLAGMGIGAHPAPTPPAAAAPKPASDDDGERDNAGKPPLVFQPQWFGLACLLAAAVIELGTGPHLDPFK